MGRPVKPNEPVTAERIERALDKLAEIIVFLGDDGVEVLPIYERLEMELEPMKQLEAKMDEIRARAARSKLRRQHKDRS
ncbi:MULTISPECIES: hypothetical protein [unclassified Agrobacterium]|uniref:hypothetical protein n=1 Tax=unclassified Agrobacterium TaxID=2632611 RepID=UPI002448FA7E|nr:MULTISPECIES: hypothetical protein [unclassified Agrobacterium]MDH0613433.1 hypothetical protein [Agrobacterium sp. GD03872]MDH0697350.1 hypothetical protein [Agrobacterium sp. GD03871]MDH1060873.1 hypothetical protein [Agrobacterium sp. GD03992]MDH2211457.1 hypothetical protein [Agrobacterium sp. GD03643]MDH2220716.1 hypothetical protein [Agrobacterium sp. GD03638]